MKYSNHLSKYKIVCSCSLIYQTETPLFFIQPLLICKSTAMDFFTLYRAGVYRSAFRCAGKVILHICLKTRLFPLDNQIKYPDNQPRNEPKETLKEYLKRYTLTNKSNHNA